MSEIRIGTSGWHYASWRGPFFPDYVPKKDWLRFYATQFDSAELNAPFYRTPTLDAVKEWQAQTPADFRFAWKASKFITHWKRLSAKSKNSIALMETRLKPLGKKAGPVLFQLPPRFEADPERLESFIKLLKKRRSYVFEFRHPSWYTKEIYAVLRKHNAALCFSDHIDAPAPWEVTAHHIYIRAHGTNGRYAGSYSGKTLKEWARKIRAWHRARRDVYCYFDNDTKSAAPFDALRLMRFVNGSSQTSP
ncbi:MAG TPA: DUF72 domain-containing protein [Xanthobacteraceae bacterium]|nr:DUF72 domain-containing protein [Xanthobacteraceae bacterium]